MLALPVSRHALALTKFCVLAFYLFMEMVVCHAALPGGNVGSHRIRPLLSAGVNLLLVIPGVLVVNTPLWIAYPYCYSGYLVSCSLHDFTAAKTADAAFSLFPFLPWAGFIFGTTIWLAVAQFGKRNL